MDSGFKKQFFFPEKQSTSETKSVQCGSWTKHADGGAFTSPNYPSKYPPDRECIYIIEGEEASARAGENSQPNLATSKLWMDNMHIDIKKIGFGDHTHKYLWVNQIAVESGVQLIIEIISNGL